MALKHQEEYEREFKALLEKHKMLTIRGAGSLGATEIWASPRPRWVVFFQVKASGEGGDVRLSRKRSIVETHQRLLAIERSNGLVYYALRVKGRSGEDAWRLLKPSMAEQTQHGGLTLRWASGYRLGQVVGTWGWSGW